MVEIPDSLRSVFTGTVQERNGTYVIDIPLQELTNEAITVGETYRVALLDVPPSTATSTNDASSTSRSQQDTTSHSPGPPVEEGEVRTVTIETVGDEGDGIAKVDHGYVIIVPDTQPGAQPTVEIDEVQANLAFASVIDRESRTP